MEDFGIIIACYEKDYSFTKGCCASIRYFLGDVPICLIVDGDFPTEDVKKTYDVRVLYRHSVSARFLRERSFGWGITKMVAFWESPWQNFLFLDADTVVWGNILKYANFNDFDMIIDCPNNEDSEESVYQYFFDVEKIKKRFPDFHWQNRPYVCTGVYFAKRNLFPLEEYIELVELQASDPNLFYPGEQGLLNFMIFRAADEGRIRLGREDIQTIVPDFPLEQLKKRFPIENNKPCQDEDTTVIHWCGNKPFLVRDRIYAKPMNFFRRKFLRDARNYHGLAADFLLQIEDFNAYKSKFPSWLSQKMKKLSLIK